MKRDAYEKLLAWSKQAKRKPLVLRGARQVGKSHLLREFGNSQYRRYHEVNFQLELDLRDIFAQTLDAREIVRQLEFRLGEQINLDKDLLILDEIQECPGAITSLKSFREQLPALHVACAGSYIGLQKNEESFPVGQVQFIQMFPMTYAEFLLGIEDSGYEHYQEFVLESERQVPATVHRHLFEMLQYYLAVGGLPEVVEAFKEEYSRSKLDALRKAREVQLSLVNAYESDFSKHSGTVNANHIQLVFQSVPTQLAKAYDESISKYRFKDVIPKQGRFRAVEGPLRWLEHTGLVIRVPIVNNVQHPLLADAEDNRFKLLMFDVGILNCMLRLPPEVLLESKVDSYKGYIVENFVAQELSALGADLYSFNTQGTEIEFLLPDGSDIIPLEVKSSSHSRRAKSLFAYLDR